MVDSKPQPAPATARSEWTDAKQTSASPTTPTAQAPPASSPLPKLTPAEFRIYNRLAEHMDYFHNHFRQTWNTLYSACELSKRPKGMSIRQFLSLGQEFCHHLTMHHSIEEVHVFPMLAKKMPAFRKELELLTQHKQIHKGLDKLEAYLESCKSGEKELRLDELKEILDGFGEVLWQHLDDEVKELGGENMSKYWTVEEMKRLVM
ncbi:hypothetical protein GQ43DRAFT_441896 [Delitschia confertaspora ATCC 74209]|uniref:Hemerythrin-like domain-containing protein n=1 Tax=Delitschia confertaspora ATCC 74209 TaxID=1513339 RepID=A0A9P4JJ65_9PLEO|nr:hypothetical protein GQ43DRAFT_441896 [Delitschia confertaspora ATCC 74209]